MASVKSRRGLRLFGFAVASAAVIAGARARVHKHVNFLADHNAKPGPHDIHNDIRS